MHSDNDDINERGVSVLRPCKRSGCCVNQRLDVHPATSAASRALWTRRALRTDRTLWALHARNVRTLIALEALRACASDCALRTGSALRPSDAYALRTLSTSSTLRTSSALRAGGCRRCALRPLRPLRPLCPRSALRASRTLRACYCLTLVTLRTLHAGRALRASGAAAVACTRCALESLRPLRTLRTRST